MMTDQPKKGRKHTVIPVADSRLSVSSIDLHLLVDSLQCFKALDADIQLSNNYMFIFRVKDCNNIKVYRLYNIYVIYICVIQHIYVVCGLG